MTTARMPRPGRAYARLEHLRHERKHPFPWIGLGLVLFNAGMWAILVWQVWSR